MVGVDSDIEAALEHLGAVADALDVTWTGTRWTGLDDPVARRVLRQEAEALGLAPEGFEWDFEWDEDGLVQELDEQYVELLERRERARRLRLRERITDTFRRVITAPGVRPLARRDAEAVARLVELGLPADAITAETVAWAAAHPTLDVDVEVPVHVDPKAVKAVEAAAVGEARPAVLARRRDAVLYGGAFDAETVAADLGLTVEDVSRIVESVPPEVQIRAQIKRHLVALWQARRRGTFPERAEGDRWARIAWLAMVALAAPPVFPDRRRWDARTQLEAELAGLTLTVGQLSATVATARRAVGGAK
jgi:hypothetical protein